MDRNRTVAGLDVHKDSIYLCIMGHDEVIIFEKYGVLTPDLRRRCANDMGRTRCDRGRNGEYGSLLGAGMERTM